MKWLTLWKLKRYEVAVGAYSMAVKQDPEYASAWINLGNTLFFLDRYWEASNSFKKHWKLVQRMPMNGMTGGNDQLV
jgi:tetratricopeptide (TPR) repeat protein